MYRTSLDKTFQFYGKYDMLHQSASTPLSLSHAAHGRPYLGVSVQPALVRFHRQEIRGLEIIAVDKGSPALVEAADHATTMLRDVVDHAYWRMVELIGLLLLGGLGAALAYRGIARRWFA